MSTRRVALFQTDDVFDWLAPSGLRALETYDVAMIHAEFATAKRASNGAAFAFDETPLDYLRKRGVEVWGYCNPFWLLDSRVLGGRAEWLRIEMYKKANELDAWLRNADGSLVRPQNRANTYAVDVRNFEFVDWLAERLVALDFKTFVIDCAFAHPGAYVNDRITDAEYVAGVTRLFDILRASGKRIVANGAWEPLRADVDDFEYPYMSHVDSIMIESSTGFKSGGKWYSFLNYANGEIAGEPIRRVIDDWRLPFRNVRAVLVAKYARGATDYNRSPFATFAEHLSKWHAFARDVDCDFAAFASVHAAEINDIVADDVIEDDQPNPNDSVVATFLAIAELREALDVARVRVSDELESLDEKIANVERLFVEVTA